MANRLKKMLTEEMVRLDPPLLSTPEEVIEYCGNILVENKKAKAAIKATDWKHPALWHFLNASLFYLGCCDL